MSEVHTAMIHQAVPDTVSHAESPAQLENIYLPKSAVLDPGGPGH